MANRWNHPDGLLLLFEQTPRDSSAPTKLREGPNVYSLAELRAGKRRQSVLSRSVGRARQWIPADCSLLTDQSALVHPPHLAQSTRSPKNLPRPRSPTELTPTAPQPNSPALFCKRDPRAARRKKDACAPRPVFETDFRPTEAELTLTEGPVYHQVSPDVSRARVTEGPFAPLSSQPKFRQRSISGELKPGEIGRRASAGFLRALRARGPFEGVTRKNTDKAGRFSR